MDGRQRLLPPHASRSSGPDETQATDRFVHVAVVYQADGTIAAYRDGQPYGKPYQSREAWLHFDAGKSQVVFGLRHSPARRQQDAGRANRPGAPLRPGAFTPTKSPRRRASCGHVISEEELDAELDEADARLAASTCAKEVAAAERASSARIAIARPMPSRRRPRRWPTCWSAATRQQPARPIAAGGRRSL